MNKCDKCEMNTDYVGTTEDGRFVCHGCYLTITKHQGDQVILDAEKQVQELNQDEAA